MEACLTASPGPTVHSIPDSEWTRILDDDDEYGYINQYNLGAPAIPATLPSNLVPQEVLNNSLSNVIKILYPFGDDNILNMIREGITVHEELRAAVDLFSQIYSKRRQVPLRQVLSDISFKGRVDGLQAALMAAQAGRIASSANDAMAALLVVSVFLLDGGQGAWSAFIDIASAYVMAVLEDPRYHRNYRAAFQACNPKDEFIVKTTIWFDVIGSITMREHPRLLAAIRELFDPDQSFMSSSSMMSPMGCERVVVWALAEASNLSCWKRSSNRKGTLSQRELVRKVEEIETHLERHAPLLQPHPENPEWSRLLNSQIFRSATKLFLQSIANGNRPRVPEVRRCVDETFRYIVDTSIPNVAHNNSVFGIFLCGSLTDDPIKRHLLSLHLQKMEEAVGIGNASTVLRLLQQQWESRKRPPKASVPWREQLKLAQVLLV